MNTGKPWFSDECGEYILRLPAFLPFTEQRPIGLGQGLKHNTEFRVVAYYRRPSKS